MSDFRDIKYNAWNTGILLDSCGDDERYYDYGLYTDLCGMSVEDAMKATQFSCKCNTSGDSEKEDEDDTTKTTNILYISFEEASY